MCSERVRSPRTLAAALAGREPAFQLQLVVQLIAMPCGVWRASNCGSHAARRGKGYGLAGSLVGQAVGPVALVSPMDDAGKQAMAESSCSVAKGSRAAKCAARLVKDLSRGPQSAAAAPKA